MSDFFEPPPPPPVTDEPEYDPPPWFGPPRGTLPGVVALELLLAQSERAAVCITRLAGYPTGFEFDVVTLGAPGGELDLDPLMFGPHRHQARRAGEQGIPEELLRIGVEFADGSKATNVGGGRFADDEPQGPVMHDGGGGGGGGDWHQSEWVWPLPPPGPLSFVCEWPAAGIPLTRAEIDAQLVIDAASRARIIFQGPRSGDAPGGTWTRARGRPQPYAG